jgi:glycosyltransferase involved in cell wall biosynthesis/SAM-dependent methyltransferase
MRVAYLGTYDRSGGRNAIVQAALRSVGVESLECHVPLWQDTEAKLRAVSRAGAAPARALSQARAWAALSRRYAALPQHDVMIVGSTAHLDLPLARRLADRRGVPLVFDPLVSLVETVRDRGLLPADSVRLRALAALERRLFRLPDLLLVDSAAHARAWALEPGLPAGGSLVLPASAPALYRETASPYVARTVSADHPLRLLYAGQYIPLHGLETVLAAADRLRNRDDIRFELVGKGQMLPAMRDLAERLALPNLRFVEDWMPAEPLAREHLAPADLCLGIFGDQAKARCVLPFKVYMAMAAGRPVLTADSPACRELLPEGPEGPSVWSLPPEDPAALAAAIEHLADRPALRAQLAQAGQATWDARFAPEPLGRLLRDGLAELIEREGRRSAASGGRRIPGTEPGAGGRTENSGLRIAGPIAEAIEGATSAESPAESGEDLSAAGPWSYIGPRHAWRTELLAGELLDALPTAGAMKPARSWPILADLGCGYGSLALKLAERGASVLAFDRDGVRVAVARKRAQRAGLGDRVLCFVADATAVPLSGGSVDGLAAGEVLEHVRDDAAAAREIERVLAPGGSLALSVPAGPKRMGRSDRAAGHHRRYSHAALWSLLDGAGLETRSIRAWGWPFGRIYDRSVQGPALRAQGGPWSPIWARLGKNGVLAAVWRRLFAIDEVLAPWAGESGSGWLALCRKPQDTGPDSDRPAGPQ